MKFAHKCVVMGGLLVAVSGVWAADWVMGSTDWTQLAQPKQTKLALYLSPQQAWAMKTANPKGVAFFDVRTRAEVTYLGMPIDADALVPYVEHQEMWTDWDDKRGMYKVEPFQEFVGEIGHRMKELGLANDSPIILICRSGDRSARAADRLQEAGYTKVYSVTEGYEGDMGKDGPVAGRRALNGWKNAGLPWTYKLAKAKMYFTR